MRSLTTVITACLLLLTACRSEFRSGMPRFYRENLQQIRFTRPVSDGHSEDSEEDEEENDERVIQWLNRALVLPARPLRVTAALPATPASQEDDPDRG